MKNTNIVVLALLLIGDISAYNNNNNNIYIGFDEYMEKLQSAAIARIREIQLERSFETTVRDLVMNANDEKYYVDSNTDEYAGYIGTTQSNEEPANHDSVSGGSSQKADKLTIAGVAENNPTYLVPTGNHRQHPLSDKTTIFYRQQDQKQSGGGGNSGSEHGGESTQLQNQPKVPNQDYGTGYVGYKDEKIKYHPLIDVPKENRNYYEFVLANPYPYANLDPLLA